MKSEYFWQLSLYDWTLWVERILSLQEKRKQDQELLMELERGSMLLFAKANLKKDSGEEFRKEDFYRLSYDEIKEHSDKAEKITGESLFQQMKERFKNKPLRNGRNRTG